MLMNSEDYDAWIEQQTREINNLKNMRKSERERAIKIIEYEMKQWDDYHALKALGRVQGLIEQDDSQKTSNQTNQHPEVKACKGEEKCSKSVGRLTEDVACGIVTRNPPVDNPQDDPGQTSGVAKGDTGNSTFPADLSLFEKAGQAVLQEDKKLLEELGRL